MRTGRESQYVAHGNTGQVCAVIEIKIKRLLLVPVTVRTGSQFVWVLHTQAAENGMHHVRASDFP